MLGFALARRSWLGGDTMAALSITFLLGVILAPISWFHVLAVVVIAVGAIAADGRSLARLVTASAVAAVYLLDIPSWGAGLLRSHAVPHLTSEMLRSAYGIGALALIVLLAWLPR